MSTILFTTNNQPITLGKKLGIGGEGAVYAVNGHTDKVAKIYHVSHLPDADKQAKLRFMAENAHSDLLGYIAWVEQTLHKRRGGRVIGFLMQRIEGCAPIHTLYNPSHRRQLYPNANWQFLLYTARNIAVAVATLHKHGHVIGDINQGNLLFGKDSKVTLIDADSFQIQTPDTTHLCHVGVAHFTPPELQGNSQFDRVARSPNHDCFGLALLIFHLLFGGRHPFSGVPLIDDAGNLLEHDIKHYRYAYAPDHDKRGIKPPPTAIPIGLVPKAIQQLFVRAFTEVGRKKRPTANEWFQALEALRKNLQVCRAQKLHVYPKHLSSCPWCALEKRGLVFFGKTIVQIAQVSLNRLPDDVHKKIAIYLQHISALPTHYSTNYRQPSVDSVVATPFRTKGEGAKYDLIALLVALFWFPVSFVIMALLQLIVGYIYHFFIPDMGGIYPLLFIILIFFPIWGKFCWEAHAKRYYRPEAERRKSQLTQAKAPYQQLELTFHHRNRLSKRYNDEKHQLNQLKRKYDTLRSNEKRQRIPITAAYQTVAQKMESHLIETNKLNAQLQAQQIPSKDNMLIIVTEYEQALADFQLLKEYDR